MKPTVPFTIKVERPGDDPSGYWYSTLTCVSNGVWSFRRDNAIAALLAAHAAAKTWPLRNFIS